MQPFLKKSSALGAAMLLVTAMIWGSGFVVMKEALDGFPPALLLSLRFLISAAVLALFQLPRLKRMNRRLLGHGVLAGLVIAVCYLVQTWGLERTTPGKNAFLTAVYCVLVPFVVWAMGGRKPTKMSVLAGGICLAGIGLISLDEGWGIGLGDALSLGCGVLFAVQVTLIDRCAKEGDDIVLLTILQIAAAGVMAWLVALLTGERPGQISGASWGEVAYLSLITTALALLLQNVGQSMTEPSLAAILLSLECVSGALLSVLFYGETITLRLALGFAAVFAAVVLASRSQSPMTAKKP